MLQILQWKKGFHVNSKKVQIDTIPYWKLLDYNHNKRSKNWVAKLTGTHKQFKFDREFIKIHDLYGGEYVQLEENGIYEFKHIYRTTGWNEEVRSHGIYQLQNGELIDKTEKEVLEILSSIEKEAETVQNSTPVLPEADNKKKEQVQQIESKKNPHKRKNSIYQDHIDLIKENARLKSELKWLQN